MTDDPRIAALPDIHGHAKGEHKPFAEERPIPYTARMLFLWFFHACRRGAPRFVMVADHMNYLTFEDPAAVNLVRRALKLAQAGDLYGAAETAGVELGHAAAVSDGLRKGMRYSIGAEIDNDPRCRPDAQNIVDAMRPDGMIRSIHFLPIAHPQHGENWMWAFDNPEFKELYDVVGTERVWEIYMATLLEAIEKLPGHIVGHFYVPAKFGHWPEDATLERYEDQLLDACAERGLAVEVNSRYFYKHYAGDDEQLARYRDVHLRLLRKASRRGVLIAVGSDAHSPKDQGAAFDAVLTLLDEAKINEIAFPIGGRLARVALRATEEIRRQHAAALSAVPASGAAALRDDAADEPREESSAPPGTRDAAAGASGEPRGTTRALPRRAKVRSDVAPAGDLPPELARAAGADDTPDDARLPSTEVDAEASPVPSPALPGAHAASPSALPADAGADDVAAGAVALPAARKPTTRKPTARKRAGRAALAAVDQPTVEGGAVAEAALPAAEPVAVAVPVALVKPSEPAPGLATLVPKPRVRSETPTRPASVAAPPGRAVPLKKSAANRVRTKKASSKKAAAKPGGGKRLAAKKPASRKAPAASTSRAVKKAAPRKSPAPKKAAATPSKRPPAIKRTALKGVAPKHTVKKPGSKKKIKPRR